MIIEVYPDNRSIKITREIFEPGVANVKALIDNIANSSKKPKNFEVVAKDTIRDLSKGLFDSELYSVDVIINGKRSSITINSENLDRYNRGLPVLLVSC